MEGDIFSRHAPVQSHIFHEEDLQGVIQVELPRLHVVHSARNDEEVIVLPKNQLRAFPDGRVHDRAVFLICHIVVAVAAEEVVECEPLALCVGEGFLNALYLGVAIAPGTATAGEGTVPREQVKIVVKCRPVGGH